MNFVLAMLNYPDVMHKAQAELDSVVGRERLPTFDDLGKLPYIHAIVRETLRWRPTAPLGMLNPLSLIIVLNVYDERHYRYTSCSHRSE